MGTVLFDTPDNNVSKRTVPGNTPGDTTPDDTQVTLKG